MHEDVYEDGDGYRVGKVEGTLGVVGESSPLHKFTGRLAKSWRSGTDSVFRVMLL